MKFRQATIIIIVALFSLIGATEPPHRRRRSLQSKSSNAATHTNQNTTASVLAAQTGTECFLTLGSDPYSGLYNLVVNKINPVTTFFEERPGRRAGTTSTDKFRWDFAANFGADPPNAAVTLTDETGHHNNTVFIVILTDLRTERGGGITYTVAQSPSQEGVLSLDSVYKGITSVDNSCSIFIDGYYKNDYSDMM